MRRGLRLLRLAAAIRLRSLPISPSAQYGRLVFSIFCASAASAALFMRSERTEYAPTRIQACFLASASNYRKNGFFIIVACLLLAQIRQACRAMFSLRCEHTRGRARYVLASLRAYARPSALCSRFAASIRALCSRFAASIRALFFSRASIFATCGFAPISRIVRKRVGASSKIRLAIRSALASQSLDCDREVFE